MDEREGININIEKGLDYFERITNEKVVLSDVNVIDKDIGGAHGTDFEMANRKIGYDGECWLIEYDHTKTIQPPFGQTITKTIKEYVEKLNRERLILFLHGDEINVKELKMFYTNLDK